MEASDRLERHLSKERSADSVSMFSTTSDYRPSSILKSVKRMSKRVKNSATSKITGESKNHTTLSRRGSGVSSASAALAARPAPDITETGPRQTADDKAKITPPVLHGPSGPLPPVPTAPPPHLTAQEEGHHKPTQPYSEDEFFNYTAPESALETNPQAEAPPAASTSNTDLGKDIAERPMAPSPAPGLQYSSDSAMSTHMFDRPPLPLPAEAAADAAPGPTTEERSDSQSSTPSEQLSLETSQEQLPAAHANLPPLPAAHANLPPLPAAHANLPPLPAAHADLSPLPAAHADLPPLPAAHTDRPPLPAAHKNLPPLPAQDDAPPVPISKLAEPVPDLPPHSQKQAALAFSAHRHARGMTAEYEGLCQTPSLDQAVGIPACRAPASSGGLLREFRTMSMPDTPCNAGDLPLVPSRTSSRCNSRATSPVTSNHSLHRTVDATEGNPPYPLSFLEERISPAPMTQVVSPAPTKTTPEPAHHSSPSHNTQGQPLPPKPSRSLPGQVPSSMPSGDLQKGAVPPLPSHCTKGRPPPSVPSRSPKEKSPPALPSKSRQGPALPMRQSQSMHGDMSPALPLRSQQGSAVPPLPSRKPLHAQSSLGAEPSTAAFSNDPIAFQPLINQERQSLPQKAPQLLLSEGGQSDTSPNAFGVIEQAPRVVHPSTSLRGKDDTRSNTSQRSTDVGYNSYTPSTTVECGQDPSLTGHNSSSVGYNPALMGYNPAPMEYSSAPMGHAAPMGYNPALMAHNPAPMGHNPAPMGHNRAPMGHNPAPMGHNPAPMGHNAAPMGFSPADMGHNTSPMGHSPAPMGHKPAPIEYSPAPMGNNTAPMGHSPAPMGHTPATMEYNPAPMGYNPATMGYSPAPMAYNAAPMGYNTAPMGHNPAPMGHNPAPMGHNPAPMGYNPAPMGYNPSHPAHNPSSMEYNRSPAGHNPTPMGSGPAVGYNGVPVSPSPLSAQHGDNAFRPVATSHAYVNCPAPQARGSVPSRTSSTSLPSRPTSPLAKESMSFVADSCPPLGPKPKAPTLSTSDSDTPLFSRSSAQFPQTGMFTDQDLHPNAVPSALNPCAEDAEVSSLTTLRSGTESPVSMGAESDEDPSMAQSPLSLNSLENLVEDAFPEDMPPAQIARDNGRSAVASVESLQAMSAEPDPGEQHSHNQVFTQSSGRRRYSGSEALSRPSIDERMQGRQICVSYSTTNAPSSSDGPASMSPHTSEAEISTSFAQPVGDEDIYQRRTRTTSIVRRGSLKQSTSEAEISTSFARPVGEEGIYQRRSRTTSIVRKGSLTPSTRCRDDVNATYVPRRVASMRCSRRSLQGGAPTIEKVNDLLPDTEESSVGLRKSRSVRGQQPAVNIRRTSSMRKNVAGGGGLRLAGEQPIADIQGDDALYENTKSFAAGNGRAMQDARNVARQSVRRKRASAQPDP